MRSAAVEKPPQGRHFHLAGVIMLLDVGRAATEEQEQMERGMRDRLRQSLVRLASYVPPTPEGR